MQGKIEELSKRGRGKTAEPAKPRVASDFQGRFKLGDGAPASCPRSRSTCPARKVELAGTYALKPETLDFKGQLLLDAKISQTMTGCQIAAAEGGRSAVQEEERHRAARSPSKSAERAARPTFGLDVHRVFKRGDQSSDKKLQSAHVRAARCQNRSEPMWIVRIALRRPYTFVVLALLILMVGPLTIARTPTDIFPNINIPVVTVVWNYGGLSADEMSNRIVSIYERSLTTTVNDIEHIESQSLRGIAVVKVFFQPGAKIDLAVAQVTAVVAVAAAPAAAGHAAAVHPHLQRVDRADPAARAVGQAALGAAAVRHRA